MTYRQAGIFAAASTAALAGGALAVLAESWVLYGVGCALVLGGATVLALQLGRLS